MTDGKNGGIAGESDDLVARKLWDRNAGSRARQIAYGDAHLKWDDAPEQAKAVYRRGAQVDISDARDELLAEASERGWP